MDPFLITPAERSRFEQQFTGLKPNNGVVTGEQAKGFFLQSQLPPAILGIIWGLADTDADGKMNINEFSIACKLINLKIRGFEIPKTLPPSLQSLVIAPMGVAPVKAHIHSTVPASVTSPPLIPGIAPMQTTAPPPKPAAPVTNVGRIISPPSGGASPTILSPSSQITPLSHGIVSPPRIPSLPSQPIIPPQAVYSTQAMSVQALSQASPSQQILSTQPSIIPTLPSIPPQPVMPPLPIIPVQPVIQSQPLIASHSILHQTQPIVGINPPAVAVPPSTLIGLTQAQPSKPVSSSQSDPSSQPVERVASTESPHSTSSPLVEWAVPQVSKLKYTQLFNTTDKSRTGFLSGGQARNIFLASQLPEPVLARIWALSDMDADGRLSCEEFVLALHLCDLARLGETIPTMLPPNLVPPTLRKQRNNSLSLSEQGDPLAGISSVTFEDKRKENFEKGQAELERRRKALLEIQKKEQEERERKEREEREKQEKIRLEQERKRQEEFERQVERQRELEKSKEEERKRAQEQREAARREMERQRQIEWEQQRCQELQNQRQKQQEHVLSIKAKNQALTIELSQLNEKVKDFSKQISETRCNVTSVKSTIDGMRGTRDEQMSELNRLKGLLKQQNQRLVTLSQQKAKLEAQGKLGKDNVGEEQAKLAFNNKLVVIKNLKEKVADLEEQVKLKMSDVENNNSQLDNLKEQLSSLISECEELYPTYEEKCKKIYEMKGIRTDNTGWGDNAWDSAQSWPEESDTIDISGYNKYRALYEFVARNGDELSFQPGDIIMVPTTQNAEPGWLSGELRGATGWFPESYVEPLDGVMDSSIQNNLQAKTPLEGIAEVAENVSESDFAIEDGPGLPIGPDPIIGLGQPVDKLGSPLYSFFGKKSSHLTFTKEDSVKITELQDQWCYGECNGKEGWFPKSYVQISDAQVPNATQSVTGAIPPDQQEYYVALYPYNSEEMGDLTFDQGETVLVVAKEGDWWTGIVGDRSGIFPSNYVQKSETHETVVEATPITETILSEIEIPLTSEPVLQNVSETKIEPQKTGGSSSARTATPEFSTTPTSQIEGGIAEEIEAKGGGKIKKPEIATVVAPYQASSNEQLSLQRGQLIMIRKKTSTGWWEGELQAKGRKRQIGWFPASYVKLLGGGSGRSARTSGAATPSDSSGERVIALYQYVAQNEDELSFEKDDIITIIAKDEPSWWKGEFNGASGLFPSNYVGSI